MECWLQNWQIENFVQQVSDENEEFAKKLEDKELADKALSYIYDCLIGWDIDDYSLCELAHKVEDCGLDRNAFFGF